MNRIEQEVHAHFAEAAAHENGDATAPAPAVPSTPASSSSESEIPFANVNSVIPGSPADSAGMEAGDHVVRFGTVNWMNHDKLAKVAEVVSQNEGVTIPQPLASAATLTPIPAPNPSSCQTRRWGRKCNNQESDPHSTSELGRQRHAGVSSTTNVIRKATFPVNLGIALEHDIPGVDLHLYHSKYMK